MVRDEFHEGDRVRVGSQKKVGKILRIDKGKAVIAVGTLKLKVVLSQLEKVEEDIEKTLPQREKRQALSVVNRGSDEFINFQPAIDLHDMYVQEALDALDKFIDKAKLLGHTRLKVIHGKGKGILRKVVKTHLQSHSQIKEVVDNHPYRGGIGVTFVELR
ncbi:MAG: Smr/MutS family protein [Cytophagales bacterium]|nr:Smr/MutS family protein [Cytophagales bacterium]